MRLSPMTMARRLLLEQWPSQLSRNPSKSRLAPLGTILILASSHNTPPCTVEVSLTVSSLRVRHPFPPLNLAILTHIPVLIMRPPLTHQTTLSHTHLMVEHPTPQLEECLILQKVQFPMEQHHILQAIHPPILQHTHQAANPLIHQPQLPTHQQANSQHTTQQHLLSLEVKSHFTQIH